MSALADPIQARRTRPGRPAPAGGVPPFQVFLDVHREAVYRFLFAAVGPNEVDDCFQETFLSALRAYPRLRDARNLRGWILTIAARKAADSARGRARRPSVVPDVTVIAGDEADPTDPAPADPGSQLWTSVRELPFKQRVAVALRVVADLPYREVAAALASSEEAARANVYQGLRALREKVDRDED